MATELRKVSATLSDADGGDTNIDKVEWHSGLNRFDAVSISRHPEVPAVAKKVMTNELIAETTAAQRQVHRVQTRDDLYVEIFDGISSHTLSGLKSAPSLVFRPGAVGKTINVVQSDSIISGIRTDIYQLKTEQLWREDHSPDGPSISERTRVLLQELIKFWEDSTYRKRSRIAAVNKVEDAVHEQNKLFLPKFYEILSNSDSSTSYTTVGELPAPFSASVNSYILNILRQSSTDFFQTLLNIATAFKLVYVPAPKVAETSGKLVRMADLVRNYEKKSIAVTDFNFTLGPTRSLPVGQVIVTASGDGEWRDNKQMSEDGMQGQSHVLMGIWPEEFLGGQVVELNLPGYFQGPMHPAEVSQPNQAFSGDGYESNRDAYIASMDQAAEKLQAYCTEFARMEFIDASIGNDRATVSTELDFGWNVGQGYEVEAKDAETGAVSAFRGVLVDATHTLSLDGMSPLVNTTLNFTFTEMHGFTMPFKDAAAAGTP